MKKKKVQGIDVKITEKKVEFDEENNQFENYYIRQPEIIKIPQSPDYYICIGGIISRRQNVTDRKIRMIDLKGCTDGKREKIEKTYCINSTLRGLSNEVADLCWS